MTKNQENTDIALLLVQEEAGGREGGLAEEDAPVIRSANLKKLKSNRKKWCVLVRAIGSERTLSCLGLC